MIDLIQGISNVMSVDVLAMKSISHNLANINTDGYRASQIDGESLVFSKIYQTAMDDLKLDVINKNNSPSIKATGRGLDIAVNGDAGLLVRNTNGEFSLVSGGSFRLAQDGTVRDGKGGRLQSALQDLVLPSGEITIKPNGEVFNSLGDFIQTIEVYEKIEGAIQPHSLKRAVGSSILQGHTITSDVKPTEELVDNLRVSRHAQTMGKVIQMSQEYLNSVYEII